MSGNVLYEISSEKCVKITSNLLIIQSESKNNTNFDIFDQGPRNEKELRIRVKRIKKNNV